MREHFRWIKEYGHRYQISDRRRVRNAKGKILSTHTNSNGCVRVTLYVNGDRYIHSVNKLMRKAFEDKNWEGKRRMSGLTKLVRNF